MDADLCRGFDLWAIRPDGSDPQRLTAEPGDEASPSWSPDGTQILFIEHGAEQGSELVDLRVMDANGREPLTHSDAYDGMQDWH